MKIWIAFPILLALVAFSPLLSTARAQGPPFDSASGSYHIGGPCGTSYLTADTWGKLIDGNWRCDLWSGGTMDNFGSVSWVQGHFVAPSTGWYQLKITINFMGVYLCCDSSRYTDIYISDPTGTPGSSKLWEMNTNSGSTSFSQTVALYSHHLIQANAGQTVNWIIQFQAYSRIPCCFYSGFTSEASIFINDVTAIPSPTIDGSAQANCSHYTLSCPATLSTTSQNDIIIVFTSETLDLASSCTFSVRDTAGLSWGARSPVVYGRYDPSYGWRDQLQEWWAKSTGVLSSDTITESISGCNEPYYGGEYNGLEVFAIKNANFNNPFDPNSALPATNGATSSGSSATVSTSNSNTIVFAGVQIGGATPSSQSGFTMIISSGGAGSEYEIPNGTLANFQVTFSFSPSGPWEEIADAVTA